jgi:hypothetical protein
MMKVITCVMKVPFQAKEINTYGINNMIINNINIFEFIFIRNTGLFFAPARLFLPSLPEAGIFFVPNRKKGAIGWPARCFFRPVYGKERNSSGSKRQGND